MVTYTTTNFVTNVKTIGNVPAANNTFTSSQILTLGDMQMRTFVAPKIAACRENYWLTTNRQEVDSVLNRYFMPSKAQGNSIVDVKVETGSYLIHLVRLEVGDLYSTQFNTLPAYGYWLEDNILHLNPPNVPGDLLMYYYRIPSQLVATTACAQITEIDYETGEITCATVPSSFIGDDIELDIVSQQPGFNVIKKDSVPDSIVGMVITFDEVPLETKVGDYICLAGQSCVIQAPLEWVEVLVQATVCKIYEIQGNLNKLAVAKKILDEMIVNATSLISPRTVENSKVIFGGGSLLQPQNVGFLPVKSQV